MRVSRQMTQAQLARAAGVTGQSVSNHETGRAASLEALHAYARALGCRPEDLTDSEPAGTPGRPTVQMYPAPVVELLRARRELDITPEELSELTRYVADGHPDDVDSLEIELLLRRAGRDPKDDAALNEFAAAVNRRRVAEGVAPWPPAPASAPRPTHPKHAKKRA